MDGVRVAQAWMVLLYVLPDHRRGGIGSCLEAVREVVRSHGRTHIETLTLVGASGGAPFAQRAGARPGLVVDQNRCPMAGLDTALLRAWCDRAAERAVGYSLLTFDGDCPEEHLDAYVAAVPIIDTAPRAEWSKDFAPNP